MDRTRLGRGGDGSSAGFFASPASPFPPPAPPSSSAKPSAAAGLSKPRLVKVRKHLASPRVRPAVIAEADDGSGFNPFRPGLGNVTTIPAEGDDRGTAQGIDENLRRWKPFGSGDGVVNPENLNLDSATSGGGVFIFGTGCAKNGFDSALSSGDVASGGADFVSNPSMKSAGSAFSFGSDQIGGSSAGAFTFGGGMSSSSSERNSLEDTSVQIPNVSGPTKPTRASFVFGASSLTDLSEESIGSRNNTSHVADSFVFGSNVKESSNSRQISPESSSVPGSVSFDSGKLNSAAFVFGSNGFTKSDENNTGSVRTLGGTTTFHSGKNGISATDVSGPVSDLGNSVMDAHRNPRNPQSKSSGSSTSHSANLPFEVPTEHNMENGDSVSSNIRSSFVNLNTGNCNSGTFPIASGMGMSSSLESLSDASDEGSFSRLPDELRKLNLHGSSKGYASVNAKQSDRKSELHDDGNNFYCDSSKDPSSFARGFGSIKSESAAFVFSASSTGNVRKAMDTEGMKGTFTRESNFDSDASSFRFTTGASANCSSNQIPSIVSEKSVLEKLPDELYKLKLQNSLNEDVLEKTKQNSQSRNGHYVFGSSTYGNAPGPFTDTLVDKMPGITNKLNRGAEQAPQKMKNEHVNHPAGAFIFGKYVNKGSATGETLNASSTIFAKSSSSEFSDDMQRQKREGSKDEDNSIKQKNNECAFNASMNSGPNGFTFGTNVKVSSSIGGSTFYTLSNDMKKLNIESKEGHTTGNSQRATDAHSGTCDTSEFQTGCEHKRINMDDFRTSEAHDHSMPTQEHMPSFDSTSFSCDSGSYGRDFTFTDTRARSEVPYSEFITSNPISSGLIKEGLFTGKHQGEPSSMKGGNKAARTKKKRGKLRQHFPLRQNSNTPYASMDKVVENKEPESPSGCSPMDYSPYRENVVADQGSREASVTSDEAFCTFPRDTSTATQISAAMEDNLVYSAQHLDIGRDAKGHGEAYADNYKRHTESEVGSKSSEDEKVFVPLMENLVSESSNIYVSSDTNITAMEAEASFGSNIEPQVNDGAKFFTFASSSRGFNGSNINFSAPSFSQGSQSGLKHQHRRKHRVKGGHDSNSSTKNADVPSAFCSSNLIPVANTPMQPNLTQDQASILSGPQSGDYRKSEVNAKPETGKISITKDAETVAEQEACEKWRLRGNQAYANGDLSKAEEYYTRGIKCISQSETTGSCNRALMLCYSNRAATRMSLGRMREALRDCMMATAIDPSFIRAQVRAANCYLSLGEIEDAVELFNKCLQSDKSRNVDQKILVEASEGLRKTQQVLDYIVQSEELLQKRTSHEAVIALNSICEAILISPYSERLMERKADALLMLQRYDEVIQFCEQTMEPAKKNHVSNGADVQLGNNLQNSHIRTWRWHAIGKAYFYLGKLEEALELLKKHEQVKVKMDDDETLVSSMPLVTTITELLRLKVAGNGAFQAGRHSEAVEHYTAALACNTESRPFAAICFCNRAAAFQALGQITDAIADCTLSIALDATYPKALSRRATLHEMIRDYGQAANDLRRLISLLERQYVGKDNHSESLGRSMSNNADVHRVRMRLSTTEEEARKDTPLDMYMILGIEPSSSAADVKKAYRKAALRHHPDKAGQLIARSEILDDSLWRQVIDEVHKDADRLFKMIGEAYTILSDPTKRLQYDEEEEMRKFLKKGHTKSSYNRGSQDGYSSQYDRNLNRHRWQTNESSNWRRSEYSRSNR